MLRFTKKLLLNQKFKIGQTASISKQFSKSDVLAFAQLSGDTNSIHIKENNNNKVIVHGCLLLGMFSAIGGTMMPGDGAFLVNISELKIIEPVYSDQKVAATLEITKNLKNKFLETKGKIKCENSGKILVESKLMLKV